MVDVLPCSRCKAPTTKRCSRCHRVHFCSPACMKASWKEHKRHCAFFATLPDDSLERGPDDPLEQEQLDLLDAYIKLHYRDLHALLAGSTRDQGISLTFYNLDKPPRNNGYVMTSIRHGYESALEVHSVSGVMTHAFAIEYYVENVCGMAVERSYPVFKADGKSYVCDRKRTSHMCVVNYKSGGDAARAATVVSRTFEVLVESDLSCEATDVLHPVESNASFFFQALHMSPHVSLERGPARAKHVLESVHACTARAEFSFVDLEALWGRCIVVAVSPAVMEPEHGVGGSDADLQAFLALHVSDPLRRVMVGGEDTATSTDGIEGGCAVVSWARVNPDIAERIVDIEMSTGKDFEEYMSTTQGCVVCEVPFRIFGDGDRGDRGSGGGAPRMHVVRSILFKVQCKAADEAVGWGGDKTRE